MTMRRYRIQTYRAADGWRWRARANGRIVADSGEAYRRRIDAHRGARAARRALE